MLGDEYERIGVFEEECKFDTDEFGKKALVWHGKNPAAPHEFQVCRGSACNGNDTAIHLYATRTYRERSTQRNRAIETIIVGACRTMYLSVRRAATRSSLCCRLAARGERRHSAFDDTSVAAPLQETHMRGRTDGAQLLAQLVA